MAELCNRYNLFYEFVKAVDGKLLQEEILADACNTEKAMATIGRQLTRGEIGCALSHRSIYQRMLRDDIESAIILEDDVDFDERLIVFRDSIHLLPDTCELVLLGHHSAKSREIATAYSFLFKHRLNGNLVLRRPCELVCGAYGYWINKSGAQKLYRAMRILDRPADHFTGSDKYINLYILEKPIIHVNKELEYFSNIERYRSIEQKKKIISKITLKKKIAIKIGIYKPLRYLINSINTFLRKFYSLKKYYKSN